MIIATGPNPTSLMLWQRRIRHSIVALAGCFLTVSAAGAEDTPDPDPATQVTIQQGDIVGTRGRDNARAWYGIPFAEPPVGALRWRAPRPKQPWTGTFEALDFTSRCFQYTSGVEKDVEPDQPVGSEDCLHLNVWAPDEPSKEPLPVMVWIHGGGNVWGYSGQYELGRMAQKHKLVVVSANYRLGPFGWFADPSLMDSAEGPLDKSVNFGTLDLIETLNWIQANIRAFGGDPDNVTVFGESAGGFNIAALLSSPLADGKIDRAIIQSGGFQSFSLETMLNPTVPDGTRKGLSSGDIVQALEQRGIIDPAMKDAKTRAAALQAIPADVFFDVVANAKPDGENMLSAIETISTISDGVVVPKEGVLASLDTPGGSLDIPVMMGTNKDEVLGLAFGEEGMVSSLFNVAFWPKDKEYYQASGEYPTRFWRALGVNKPAHLLSANRSSDVFVYRFDWDEQGRTFTTNISEMVGAAHAMDIPFILGEFEGKTADPMGIAFKKSNLKGRLELSAAMMSYWAEFAYGGDPGRGRDGTLPRWQAWTPESDTAETILLDTSAGGGIRMVALKETSEDIMKNLGSDPRLEKGVRRCYVAAKSIFVLSRFVDDVTPYQAWVKDVCGTLDPSEVPAYSE